MARIRKNEPAVIVSAGGAAAAPVRRKPATAHTQRPQEGIEAKPAMDEPKAVPYSPAHDQIAELAYSYWAIRGYQGGSPREDWLRAERELRNLGS